MADELDRATLSRCRRGDAAAFRALVETYQDRVYALCVALAGSDAEDLTQETFVRVHGALAAEVRFCYEQALKDSPNLAGRIVVRMTLVTNDGVARVRDGEIQPEDDGDIPSLAMQSCVLQAFSRWTFPPSVDGGDVVVSYPFVFKAGND